MGCAVEVDDPTGWLNAFHQRAAERRIPVSAVLGLTSRCNLRCRHCYLGNQAEQHKARSLERDTEAVKKSIDEWAEAGCFHLVITGGDPMMRKDFMPIYRHAAEQGLFVTVFCDGILVTDEVVQLFTELPPRSVEISIFGATAETYENVTRVPGSHARAWQGIRRLLAIGVRVMLKTVVLTLNQHELTAMAAQAEEAGCAFRFDSAVFPCLADNGTEPLELRVSPETAVQLDLSFPGRKEKWAANIKKNLGREVGDLLYACGAGATTFYVDPYGNLSPCLMTTPYRYQDRGRPFREVWRDDLSEIRSKKRTKPGGCLVGPLRGACTHCPAFNKLETGDEEIDSPHMRRTAELRYRAVMHAPEEAGPRLEIGPLCFRFEGEAAAAVRYDDWAYREFLARGDAPSAEPPEKIVSVRLVNEALACPSEPPLYAAGRNWAVWAVGDSEYLFCAGFAGRPRARRACRVDAGLQRATLYMDGDAAFEPLRYPLDQVLSWGLLAPGGGLCLHAAAVEHGGVGVVFAGRSGAGKSTLSALCHEAGWSILNDDRAMVFPRAGAWKVAGTPWHGSGVYARNREVPLRAVCLLEQDPQNALEELPRQDALRALLDVTSIPWFEETWSGMSLGNLERLVDGVAVRRFRFSRSHEAAAVLQGLMRR